MAYRTPSNLGDFVPPPGTRRYTPSTFTRPWRGTFLVSGLRASDNSSNQEIRITSVETDGDARTSIWPDSLMFSVSSPYALPIFLQLQSYIRQPHQTIIPLVTFLPDRLRDPNTNAVNLSNFRNVARVLHDNESVGFASLTADSPISGAIPASGILIFPASNSTTMLLGAVFADGVPFPDFVQRALRGEVLPITPPSASLHIPISPSVLQARSQQSRLLQSTTPYSPGHRESYASTSTTMHYRSSASLSPPDSYESQYSNEHSSLEPQSSSQQQQYRYPMPPSLTIPSSIAQSPEYPVQYGPEGYHTDPSPANSRRPYQWDGQSQQ